MEPPVSSGGRTQASDRTRILRHGGHARPDHAARDAVADTTSIPSDRPVACGERCKVLVVDDNRDSADALSLLLESDGYEVRTGYSGTEALALAAQGHPEAVILDIGMPDLTA